MQVFQWRPIPTDIYHYLTGQVNFRGVYQTNRKNNPSILSAVQLHMHSVSALFFISIQHWTFSTIIHMACEVQFLKRSLSTKNKNQNLPQYCFHHSKLNLLILFDRNSNAALSPTVAYIEPIHNIRQTMKKI